MGIAGKSMKLIGDYVSRQRKSMALSESLGRQMQGGRLPGGLRAVWEMHDAIYGERAPDATRNHFLSSEFFRAGVVCVKPPERRLSNKKWLDRVTYVHDYVLKPLGLESVSICWNHLELVTARETAEHDMGVSAGWHFDNHYPPVYFKVMIYLNGHGEHGSGTSFLDPTDSLRISEHTGYIGAVGNRTMNLGDIGYPEASVIELRPEAMDSVVFWPGRVMHKGLYPTGDIPRRAWSFSFMPSDVCDRAENLRRYLELSKDFVVGADPPAFFK